MRQAHAALQQQLADSGKDTCLLVPEPFLWPVEVLMGPSALRGGRFTASSMFACNHAALERLLGLIVPGG